MFGLEMTTQPSSANKNPFNDILNGLTGKFNSTSNLQKLLVDYDEEDIQKIYADFLKIKESTFAGMSKNRKYAFTRDSSDTAKNFIDTFQSSHGYVSLDTNRSYLPNMLESYKKQPMKTWVKASNFINQLLIEIALQNGYNIVDRSEANESSEVKKLSILRQADYSTSLLHFIDVDKVYNKTTKSFRATQPLPNYMASINPSSLKDVEWTNSYMQKQKTIRTKNSLGKPIYCTVTDTVLASTVKNNPLDSNKKAFIAICNKQAHQELQEYYTR